MTTDRIAMLFYELTTSFKNGQRKLYGQASWVTQHQQLTKRVAGLPDVLHIPAKVYRTTRYLRCPGNELLSCIDFSSGQ